MDKLNPKDMIGQRKATLSCIPMPVMMEVGVGMLEGAMKYGRYNWRTTSVKSSIYFDATMRHLIQWWEGDDIDTDSGIHHISKAITSLVVLRDAMICDKFVDDRPPGGVPEDWMAVLNSRVNMLTEKYAEKPKSHFEDTRKYWDNPHYRGPVPREDNIDKFTSEHMQVWIDEARNLPPMAPEVRDE